MEFRGKFEIKRRKRVKEHLRKVQQGWVKSIISRLVRKGRKRNDRKIEREKMIGKKKKKIGKR